jgi:hypothetical protein
MAAKQRIEFYGVIYIANVRNFSLHERNVDCCGIVVLQTKDDECSRKPYSSYQLEIFLSFFFLSPTSFYLTRLRVEGYYSCDHTQRHTTVGRTPLDEGSARRRDLYLTAHNTYNRQTSMPSAGFEPAIPAGERLQTHALG